MQDRTHSHTALRSAGLLYLLIIVAGLGAEIGLRAPLRELSPEAFAAALTAAHGAWRAGIAADAAMALADAGLAVLFLWIFLPVDRAWAVAATVFRLVQTAVIAGNLVLLEAAGRLAAAGEADLAALVFGLHGWGYDLALLFFGVNAVILGRLIWRSGFIHAVFGQALMAAGGVYLVGSSLALLAPDAAAVFAPAYMVPVLAESALCLRLLASGAGRMRRTRTA